MHQDKQEMDAWFEIMNRVAGPGMRRIKSRIESDAKDRRLIAMILTSATMEPHRLPDTETDKGRFFEELWAWYEENHGGAIYAGFCYGNHGRKSTGEKPLAEACR